MAHFKFPCRWFPSRYDEPVDILGHTDIFRLLLPPPPPPRCCDPRSMLRAKFDVLKIMMSLEWDGEFRIKFEQEFDAAELRYRMVESRLAGQVTCQNEDEWRRQEEDRISLWRLQEAQIKFRVEQDMKALKQKRRILQCILHEHYIHDPRNSIRFHHNGATALYTEVRRAVIPLVNRVEGRKESVVETGASRINGFPSFVVYHRNTGETVTYALMGKVDDPGSKAYDAATALKRVHKDSQAHGAVQLSNLLFLSDGQVIDLRDVEEHNSQDQPKWTAPEVINTPEANIPLHEKQIADIYSLGATIVELHLWEGGIRDPELITMDRITRALETHELSERISPKKTLGLEQVVQRCLSVEPKERPSASQVCKMLGKVFKVELLIENAKRIASRASKALPFWHGRNMFLGA